MKLEFETNTSAIPFVENNFAGDAVVENEFSGSKQNLQSAIKTAQAGNRTEARQKLLQIVEAEPDNENAWLWLASISEYPEELLGYLNNILHINPENERALEWSKSTKALLAKNFVQRGSDASKENQKTFAKQCFEQAIFHDSENETAWLWLASVTDSAEEKQVYLQKVLSLNPENENAQVLLKALKNQKIETLLIQATTAAVADDSETANAILEEILKDAPELESAWILKSYLANTFSEKIQCYEKVLEFNPENQLANLNWTSLLEIMANAAPEENENALFNEENDKPIEKPDNLFEAQNDGAEDFKAAAKSANQKFDEEFGQIDEQPNEAAFEQNTFTETADFTTAETNFESFDSMSEETVAAENDAEDAPLQFGAFDYQSYDAQNSEPDFEVEEINADEDFNETLLAGGENAVPSYYSEFEESEVILIEEEQTGASEDQTSSAFSFAEEETFFAESAEKPEPAEEVRESSPEEKFYFEMQDEVSANENIPSYYEAKEESFTTQAKDDFTPEFEAPQAEFYEENNRSEEEVFAREEFANQEKSTDYAAEKGDDALDFELTDCPFCHTGNEPQAFVCRSCRAMLTLSDLEMLLAHNDADLETLRLAVERMQIEKSARDFDADELKTLGLAQINLKNLREGLSYLQEALRMNPNDIVLSSQVNLLAIRLSEIEDQQSVHDLQPKNRTILVVDDSATVRKLISGKLEKSGHTVICAVDGIDALEKVKELVPDLILLDINMPRMDGYHVCKLIRGNETTKDVPVVMISGKDGFFDKVRGRMAGTTGYITKPFGPETLMKTVETYII